MAIAGDRATALSQTTNDLGQAGLIFNDAVRLSNGGLWSQPADSSNQLNYASQYEADISILNTDIASAIATGATVNGVAVTPSDPNTLTEIQGQLAQLAAAAPNAVGNSAAAVQAQGVLHTNEQLIVSEIAGDTNLQKALAANGVLNDGTGTIDQGFQALPAQAADNAAAISAAKAGANLSDIGTVFNAAANLADGGLNASNLAQFNADMKAVAAGLQSFINGGGLAAAQANTAAEQALATDQGISLGAAQALTAVHAQTMLDQIELQINKFDGMYASNPNVAARSTNDNLLDIIDIAQNDPALAASAGNATGNPSHDGGFAEQPGYLAGTITHYQDNQAQTDFWSAFIAGANNLNNALTAEANGTTQLDAAGLHSLIQQVQGYEKLGTSFDGSQGGIFGARFDNELLGGTLKADTSTALQALNDILHHGGSVSAADAAQLTAAGVGFVADAADVSGNNIPNGGGSYVGTSTTVSGATTTQIADASTTTSGNVDGNEHPTNHPVNGLTNDGFGVTDPAPSSDHSGHSGHDAGPGGNGGTAPAPSPGHDHPGNAQTSNGAGASDPAPSPGHGGATAGAGAPGAADGGGAPAGSSTIASDIAALIQALQHGDAGSINNAVATLGAAVQSNAGGAAAMASSLAHDAGAGGAPDIAAAHPQHFEHMWG
jgi:trimeric autotransporter adhesin